MALEFRDCLFFLDLTTNPIVAAEATPAIASPTGKIQAPVDPVGGGTGVGGGDDTACTVTDTDALVNPP